MTATQSKPEVKYPPNQRSLRGMHSWERASQRGLSALPHLPLVQWGERYPIGAVKVGHQHLQNVLNLQEAKKENKGRGEKEKVA